MESSSDSSKVENQHNEDYLNKNIDFVKYEIKDVFGDPVSSNQPKDSDDNSSLNSNNSYGENLEPEGISEEEGAVDEKKCKDVKGKEYEKEAERERKKEEEEKEKEKKKQEERERGILIGEAEGLSQVNEGIDPQYRQMMARRFEQQRRDLQKQKLSQRQEQQQKKHSHRNQPVQIGEGHQQQVSPPSELDDVAFIGHSSQQKQPIDEPKLQQQLQGKMDDKPFLAEVFPEKKLKEEEAQAQSKAVTDPDFSEALTDKLREVVREVVREELKHDREGEERKQEVLVRKIEGAVREVVKQEVTLNQRELMQEIRDQQNLMNRLNELMENMKDKLEQLERRRINNE